MMLFARLGAFALQLCSDVVTASYPHAIKPWQGSEWPQSSKGSQRLDGAEVRIPQSIGYGGDQWHLEHIHKQIS